MRDEFDKAQNTYTVEFASLDEFYNYITTKPTNKAFSSNSHYRLSSFGGSKSFTGTRSFEEACDLFKNGWSETATNLVNRIKAIERTTKPTMKRKQIVSPCGYQAIVPLYLNNCPNNMVNSKSVACKDKIVTIDKLISYRAYTTIEEIIEESVKAMCIIKKVESMGYRVNLNVMFADNGGRTGRTIICKIKIKNASEKLNISKVAFPLVHPSMLRRLCFRFLEVADNVTKDFLSCYGYSLSVAEAKQYLTNNEYILPLFIKKDIEHIRSLDDLNSL